MARYRTGNILRNAGNYYVPVQPTPPWREEDEKRWSRLPLKPEFDPPPEAPESPPVPRPAPPAPPAVTESAPQPQPVALPETFDALYNLLGKYLVCTDHQRTILALWIVHTYCFEVFPATPYLNIYSPEKQSGKTVCLQLLRMLSHNPWMPGGGLTASRLMDRIAQRRPTLLLDDWHTAFRPTEAQSLIGFLNAGFVEESRYSLRGSEDLDIYCPKAFAGPSGLPAPLADRAIPIVLQRRRPSESVQPFCSSIIRLDAAPLSDQLRLWFKDHGNTRTVYEHAARLFFTDLPGFSMRQTACALPLLAIAHVLGGNWPRRTHLALRRVFDIHTAESLSTGLQLLQDIRAFFLSPRKQKVFTTDLLKHLNELTGRPWSRDQKGKPLNPNRFRCYLQDFDVCRSSNQWIDKQNRRGFSMQDFAASWDRYLPPVSSTDLVTVSDHAVVETGAQVVEK